MEIHKNNHCRQSPAIRMERDYLRLRMIFCQWLDIHALVAEGRPLMTAVWTPAGVSALSQIEFPRSCSHARNKATRA